MLPQLVQCLIDWCVRSAIRFGDGTFDALFRDGSVCWSQVIKCHAFLWLITEPAVEFLKVICSHGLKDALQSTVFRLIVLEPSLLLCIEGSEVLLWEPPACLRSAQSQYVSLTEVHADSELSNSGPRTANLLHTLTLQFVAIEAFDSSASTSSLPIVGLWGRRFSWILNLAILRWWMEFAGVLLLCKHCIALSGQFPLYYMVEFFLLHPSFEIHVRWWLSQSLNHELMIARLVRAHRMTRQLVWSCYMLDDVSIIKE